MKKPLDRIYEATECRTQLELANMLGIRQSSVSIVKRNGKVPAKWLLILLRLRGINPDWVLFGTGSRLFVPPRPAELSVPLENNTSDSMTDRDFYQKLLNSLPSDVLAGELLRRIALNRNGEQKNEEFAAEGSGAL